MKSAKMEHYHHKSGRRFFHLNRYESDFLYKEIFEDKVYLKHGIELCEGTVVVDVGANIGLTHGSSTSFSHPRNFTWLSLHPRFAPSLQRMFNRFVIAPASFRLGFPIKRGRPNSRFTQAIPFFLDSKRT